MSDHAREARTMTWMRPVWVVSPFLVAFSLIFTPGVGAASTGVRA
jgi:hypothetical protein